MLARKREKIVAVIGLLVLNALGVWHLWRLRASYQARTEWVYAAPRTNTGAKPASAPAALALPQNFAEIVNRNMFRPERTNESPADKALPPELPLLFGTMNLGDGRFALMAPGNQSSAVSKKVVPGGEIGGFKLVSIASSQVVVEWGGRMFTIDVSESARRVPRVIEGPPRAENIRASAAAGQKVTSVAPATAAATRLPGQAGTAATSSNSRFDAPPGAPNDAPVGTVMGGKKKFGASTPFGQATWWDYAEQQPANTTSNPEPKKEK